MESVSTVLKCVFSSHVSLDCSVIERKHGCCNSIFLFFFVEPGSCEEWLSAILKLVFLLQVTLYFAFCERNAEVSIQFSCSLYFCWTSKLCGVSICGTNTSFLVASNFGFFQLWYWRAEVLIYIFLSSVYYCWTSKLCGVFLSQVTLDFSILGSKGGGFNTFYLSSVYFCWTWKLCGVRAFVG